MVYAGDGNNAAATTARRTMSIALKKDNILMFTDIADTKLELAPLNLSFDKAFTITAARESHSQCDMDDSSN